MGTYPPRECGIATFNQDLVHSSQLFLGKNVLCKVAAFNISSLDTYTYPPEVEWHIDQNNKEEQVHLAETFNNDPTILGIIVQHEYGIYGGIDGENILTFMEECRKPILVTLHTVLPNPSRHMKSVTERVVARANSIVVLTQSSKKILTEVYPESSGKVYVIPHGIHPTAFSSTTAAKQKLKLQNHDTIVTTFGLLSRGKGIEYVIKALPAVIKKHPTLLYLILGETHPIIRRNEGESYRKELIKLVTKLHLKNHVRFYDQYLSLPDLIEFLKATDIYISTSINPNQAVSGTLSYALGTGRAVISTEFAQAKEIVHDDSGRLVPIKHSASYSSALLELLKDEAKLKEMHKQAYEQTRPMLWSNVAYQYSELLKENILPPINLTHLTTMTDTFGLFQFAKLAIPDKDFGYTLDDNARALVACSWLDVPSVTDLTGTYLHFIEKCQQADGSFINYLDHSHKKATSQNDQEDLEDATARAMWALGEVIGSDKTDVRLRALAKKMFRQAMPHVKNLHHVRSSAFIIKALAATSGSDTISRHELITCIKKEADSLIGKFERNSVKDWQWFDTYLGYNNAIVPEALFIAGRITGIKRYTDGGNAALTFLIQKTFSKNQYMPIGHSHWYTNNGKRSHFDQQPEDPASMILALVTAYEITHDETYRKLTDICFSWFLGNNALQKPLYNYENGGCYDGLHPDRVNLNQGAESLISYLLARLSVERLTNIHRL